MSTQDAKVNDIQSEEIIERYNTYITVIARRYVPRKVIHPEAIEDEIEDIVQETRIRLWKTLTLKGLQIFNIEAYIARIVRNLCADIGRRKPYHSLSLDADGELQQGHALISQSEGVQDPAYELEQKEQTSTSIVKLTEAVLKLPRIQQYAFIAFLEEHKDVTSPLLCVLRKRGIDIEAIQMPGIISTPQSQRTSFSIARKKLRSMW
jgi:DNA-directed RNA polymerase specialized sigma24 family protein